MLHFPALLIMPCYPVDACVVPGAKQSTGTLTMLHTEVEESTLLTVHLGDRYPEVLVTHRTLVQAASAALEGHEADTQGDSFFVVFARATPGIATAVEIQRALAAETWPEGGTLRVRIGVHTGEPIQTAEGYTGLDVIRRARIKEAGHGGQVLMSKSTAALIEDALTGGLGLRDLGSHRLKGLPGSSAPNASSNSSSRTCRQTSHRSSRSIRVDARASRREGS